MAIRFWDQCQCCELDILEVKTGRLNGSWGLKVIGKRYMKLKKAIHIADSAHSSS